MSGAEQLEALRARITEIDRAIFELVNRRLELVRELKQVKDDHDLPFVDPTRETSMVEERVTENPGPLSADGLRSFYVSLLALIKRELGQ
jgi:3-deoxy-7-phosphoheptulonate synthase/chorismate mutase